MNSSKEIAKVCNKYCVFGQKNEKHNSCKTKNQLKTFAEAGN